MPPRRHKTQAQLEEEQRAKKAKQDVEQKQLLELVCQHEVLYNTAHPDHLNSSITDVLWKEIANILEEDGMYFTLILLNNLQKNQQ